MMPITVTKLGKDESRALERQGFKVTFQFQRTVKIHEQALLYDIISMLAEIGGYIGVLCGYSILWLIDYLFETVNKIAYNRNKE